MAGNELQRDFRKAITQLEQNLTTKADGVDIVAVSYTHLTLPTKA